MDDAAALELLREVEETGDKIWPIIQVEPIHDVAVVEKA